MMHKFFSFISVLFIIFNSCQKGATIQPADQLFTVVLDAGHGGNDTGAVGLNGVTEKDIVLQITQKCRDLLDESAYRVILTREDDRTLQLKKRILFINQKKPNILISLHINAANDKEKNGVEIYCNSKVEPAIVDSIFSRKFQKMHFQTMPVKRNTKLSILKMVQAPVIYLNMGYLTNKEDNARLTDEKLLAQIAGAISESIKEYNALHAD